MKLKVLQVDTFTAYEAMDVWGISKAYEKRCIIKKYNYRRVALCLGIPLMNILLYYYAVWFKPDFIHLGKCEIIKGKTIKKIKNKINTKIIHFYGDMRQELQKHVVDIGKYADITLLHHKDKNIIDQYKNAGVKKIGFWWMGADPDIFKPMEVKQKEYDVVYFANNSDFLPGHEERRKLIKAIADSGIDIHLFGNNWDIFKNHQNIHLHGFVQQEKFAKACSKAKITLGYNAVNNVYFYASWKRPFGCMSCGAFHLTVYFPGLDEVFINKKHLVWFHSIKESVDLIRYYLGNDEEREKIAKCGMEAVHRNHTWDARIDEMVAIYESLGQRTRFKDYFSRSYEN